MNVRREIIVRELDDDECEGDNLGGSRRMQTQLIESFRIIKCSEFTPLCLSHRRDQLFCSFDTQTEGMISLPAIVRHERKDLEAGDEVRGGEKSTEILPDYFPRSRTRGFSFEGRYFRDS